MNWQPIETAPKDGTKILLFFPSFHQEKVDLYRYNNILDDNFPWESSDGWGAEEGEDSPTHWMPLPEGPKE